MKEKSLNDEIEESSIRIESRQSEISIELEDLSGKIIIFTNWAWRFVWLGAIISVLSVFYFFCKNTESGFALNLIGDFMAGTVGSIWSLAGLFFIYVAFLGQKQQLLNQQLEIMYSQLEVKYTRLELTGQKKEMQEQNFTLKQQKFENTFFQLLTLFNSIVNSIDLRNVRTQEVINSGRDCFKMFYETMISNLIAQKKEDTSFKIENATINDCLVAYEKLYTSSKADMSHYFRSLYHIIKFIDTSEIDNKKQYIALTRAQLSSYEQAILFYNCLHENGVEKFKPLVEKYSIFKNIDSTLLINIEHKKEYEETAFNN